MALPRLLALLLVVTFGGLDARSQPNNSGLPAPETAQAPPSSSVNAGKRLLVEIRVAGLHRLDEKTVMSWLRARKGMSYTPEDRQADIQALLASGEFGSVRLDEIDLSSDTARLDITLTEVPKIPVISTTTNGVWASTSTISVSTAAASQSIPALAEHPPVPPPWIVDDIVILGNHHIAYNTLRSDLKVRKGELYERSDLERDVQTLVGMGNFERVTADVLEIPGKPVPAQFHGVSGSSWTVRLTFAVEEKPLIHKIRFEGNKKLSRGKLSDKVTLKEKDPLNQVKLREDVFLISAIFIVKRATLALK